jgi:hypothetical protein
LRVISRVTIMIVNHVKPHVTIVLLQKTVQHVILPTMYGTMINKPVQDVLKVVSGLQQIVHV